MRTKKKELTFKIKLIIGLAVGLFVVILSCLVLSLGFSLIDISAEYAHLVGLVLSAIFSYTSAYILGKLNQNEGMKCGFCIFVVIVLLMLILSLFSGHFGFDLLKMIIIFITSQFGGIIGVNSKFLYY